MIKHVLSYPHSYFLPPSFPPLASIKLKYLKLLTCDTLDVEKKLLITKEPDEFIEL
jgi:hypothetical protein